MFFLEGGAIGAIGETPRFFPFLPGDDECYPVESRGEGGWRSSTDDGQM